jgi:hypothetical protein
MYSEATPIGEVAAQPRAEAANRPQPREVPWASSEAHMRRWNLNHYAISSCVTAALLAGCGGSQPPIEGAQCDAAFGLGDGH